MEKVFRRKTGIGRFQMRLTKERGGPIFRQYQMQGRVIAWPGMKLGEFNFRRMIAV